MKEYIEKLKEISQNPDEQIKKYVKDGKTIIGVAPFFGPEEIVDAAGFVPFGTWGAYNVELDLSKMYFPAFCPSIISMILELGLNGTYDNLSAIIIPGMSDTLHSLGQNWKSGVKNIPFISIVYPQNRKLDCGVEYLKSEMIHVKEELEKIKGSKISDDEINKSINLYNEHRKAMAEFSKLQANHPNTINNLDRSYIYKSALFMTKKEHLEIIKKINEELKNLDEETYDGKRIITTGLLLDDENILQSLEENKLRIVGDYVGEESIQYNTLVPKESDPFESLALQWKNIEGFSVAYDPELKRGNLISKLAKERKADGVVYALVKFSDYEEYDLPICSEIIRDAGFKIISFETDQQDRNSEQIKTRIQTFAEIL